MYSDCNKNCRICNRLVISNSVTIVTVGGTDTLVIDLPATATSTYLNGCKYCIVIAQAIPTTATIAMPVAFSIGGDTTTVYPFVGCNCAQITACAIQTRTKYPVCVATTAIGGSFKSLRRLNCYPMNVLASLPVSAAATAATTPISEPLVVNTRKVSTGTVKAVQKENGESSR